MATIFGVLGIQDTDTFPDSAGQTSVWSFINDYLAVQEAEADKVYGVFVESETTDHKERYFLPAGGMLQQASNLTRPGAVKPVNSWDAGYPIDDGRDQLAYTDVALAYMSAAQLDAHVRTMTQRYVNWRRFRILRALLNKTNESITDDRWGSITVYRLANADGSLFPPLIGASADLASHTHYVGSNYTAASISDTNNPYVTIRDHLEEHFGDSTMVAFINNADRAKTEALTAFRPRLTAATTPNANASYLDEAGLPAVPGRIIGSVNDVLVSEWRWIPSGYILGISLDVPAPLKKRVDPFVELQGFKMVAEQMEFPLKESFFRAREGYGVGNRLGAVALQLVASTTYTTPTSPVDYS
jgi:hypothetical protein